MKTGIYRNPKLLAAANGRPCVNCGAEDGTIVRCHYTGLRQQAYGKGTGIKCHDHIAADLCRKCHEKLDRYEHKKGRLSFEEKIDLSEQFLHLCILTITRDIKAGLYEASGKS